MFGEIVVGRVSSNSLQVALVLASTAASRGFSCGSPALAASLRPRGQKPIIPVHGHEKRVSITSEGSLTQRSSVRFSHTATACSMD